jgi:hypothetical protein
MKVEYLDQLSVWCEEEIAALKSRGATEQDFKEPENDASDRTRGKFQRNKSEMFQYLRKFIPTFLDKIFSELGEKTLSAIRLPTYFFQTSS